MNRFRVCNQSTRLKLKCDEPLSNVAFKFNVRRYVAVVHAGPQTPAADGAATSDKYLIALLGYDAEDATNGGAVQVDSIKTRVET